MKCPHCGSTLLWGEDRGAHCDGCDLFDPEVDLAAWVVSPRQLEMMQHALGLDRYGQPPEGYRGCSDDEFPKCYRNCYVTGSSSPDGQECEAMVAAGWMAKPSRQPSFIGGMTNYFVTQAGYDAVKLLSPAPPKLTRARQRYRDFLNSDGVFPNFRAYLRHLSKPTA